MATTTQLALQNLANLSQRRVLLPGTQVPRAVALDTWPYIVMSPGRDRIGLMALRLLPTTEFD